VVSFYGLTYKPDVEDLRESPALEIVRDLALDGSLKVLACEPYVRDLPPMLKDLPNVRLVGMEEARREADIVVFLVAHRQFRRIEANVFLNKVVVDTVGLLGTPQRRQEVISVNDRMAPAGNKMARKRVRA
jgi:UDP-N-acetyl-D-mannosaminuronic acid dehydrogenase